MQRNYLAILSVLILGISLAGCQNNFIKDVEGNKYKTVTIGTQIWMAENLRSTRFRDGSEINMVGENDNWAKQTSPSYSWYFNDKKENSEKYGALYNWYAIKSDMICPTGWHIPTDNDWTTLAFTLDGFNRAGGKMKEKGTTHWKSPNTEASDESGFNALPGGYRSFEGAFNYMGIAGYWWSSSLYNEENVMFWYIRYKSGFIFKSRSEKYCGFSVRCIEDK